MSSDNKIQELQMLEQSLQNLLMQKQAFQMEFTETEAALKHVQEAGEEVFKIVGQLMVKSDKKKVQEDLENKKKMIELRTKTFEKQEKSMAEQAEKLREEVMKSMKK